VMLILFLSGYVFHSFGVYLFIYLLFI